MNAKGILVATKTDLERKVSKEDELKFADKFGYFMEVSVAEQPGVINTVYEKLLEKMVKNEYTSTISYAF